MLIYKGDNNYYNIHNFLWKRPNLFQTSRRLSPRTVRLINTRSPNDQSEASLAHLWPISSQYGGCCCACRPCLSSARGIVPSKWKYPLEGLKAEYCTTIGGRWRSLSLSLQYYNSHGNFLFLYSTKLCPVEACSCSVMPLTWCQVAKRTVLRSSWDLVHTDVKNTAQFWDHQCQALFRKLLKTFENYK